MVAAVPLLFLYSSLINIKKATAKPNLTAVNHFLAEFMHFKEWFKKWHILLPPFIRLLQLFVLRNIGVGIVDIEDLGPMEVLDENNLKTRMIYLNVYISNYEDALCVLMPTNG